MRAAKEWGKPPRIFLGGLPDSDWSEVDTVLATALSIHDAELLCPCGCGGYRDHTLESDGWHEARVLTCDARRALDEHRDEGEPLGPGEFLIPAWTGD